MDSCRYHPLDGFGRPHRDTGGYIASFGKEVLDVDPESWVLGARSPDDITKGVAASLYATGVMTTVV
jgi:hypothetical protein